MSDSQVSIWQEQVIIPTYGTGKPDKNPMFFEKRVYQGSSGVVYPNPVIEKVFDEKEDKAYIGLFLENRYLKVMILPELGGRIQMAYDKIGQRHFIYYNQVIKPALVGLTGPWISGGIEFNWPQHHRPSTFEPVDFDLEEHADGSKTVWVNEIEKMFHTKGMTGFTLYPDKAYIEIKSKLYNRSPLPQTFLWWANPAVKVNDHYQSVFPPDVNAVFDHGKRDVSTFPIATGTYYKVDYSPGTDISRYKNIPVPTSYMAIHSDYDFVGGYEHDTQAGLLHVANHHISPGKKQWTWGNGDFGRAWDRNLTDEDGPYIELMTGVYTDNQPDFSWQMPYEEKSFTQYFMPYQALGIVKNATKDLLTALDVERDRLTVKMYGTSVQLGLTVSVVYEGRHLLVEQADVAPETVYERQMAWEKGWDEQKLVLCVSDSKGKELLRYEPARNRKNDIPKPAQAALPPVELENNEQLFLTGQHLEQYRHAIYNPVGYYEEALRRDPSDIRSNNALGVWYLRRGNFSKSEPYLRKAIDTATQCNPNPYDSEPYYNLGLCLHFQQRLDEAYTAFYKAAWSNAWKDSAYFSIAQIDLARGDAEGALGHIRQSLARNSENSKAYVLQSVAMRALGRDDEALAVCKQALEIDRFNLGALYEQGLIRQLKGDSQHIEVVQNQLEALARGEAHNFLEYAIDYAQAGLYSEAEGLLSLALRRAHVSPMVYYHLAWVRHRLGDATGVPSLLNQAAATSPFLCFPNRLDDIAVLEFAIDNNPSDAKAPYYLGNLFYDKRQYDQAITFWEQSANLDASFPTVWRNLGIAYFNKLADPVRALGCYEKAYTLDESDARVLMELDQLYKKQNKTPFERVAFLENHRETLLERDDLYAEWVGLHNLLGNHDRALELLSMRKFHPWEGGEGKVSSQYVYALVSKATHALVQADFVQAITLLDAAQQYPRNLGEGKLHGAQENDIFYWLGCAYAGLDQEEMAQTYWQKASIGLDEPTVAMYYNDQQPDKIFYQGLAWQRLGERGKACSIFEKLVAYGRSQVDKELTIDYFAVSLPNLLIFDDDLALRNTIHSLFMQGLGLLGLGQHGEAKKLFDEVLALETTHLGANTHSLLISTNLI